MKIEPFADGAAPARRHLLRRDELRLRRARRPASSRSSPTSGAVPSIPRTSTRSRSWTSRRDFCLIPPNSFALAETVEYLEIPRDILCVCVGKSTYARCGIIVNVTPLEPEWRGRVTIEISNTTPLPAKIYAGEGIAQILFLKAEDVCRVSYADKKGKYQDQAGLTLPFVHRQAVRCRVTTVAESISDAATLRLYTCHSCMVYACETDTSGSPFAQYRVLGSQRLAAVRRTRRSNYTGGHAMQITRRFTREGQDPFAGLTFAPRTSRIVNPNGSVVFEMKDVMVPEGWSQVAVDILAQKYFRRAGVPARLDARRRGRRARVAAAERARDAGHADRRRDRRAGRCSAASPAAGPTGAGRAATSRPRPTPGRSTTRRATCSRRRWPRRTARSGSTPACTGPTASRGRRRGTTTSIRRPSEMTRSTSAYERPAPHACFIQAVSDDLVNEGGIMDLWVREARIFKYGSRHRLELLRPPRRGRAALRRRQVVRADELPQDRRPRRRARSRAAAPRAAPRRWSSSTSTTRTSRSSSTGRSSRSRRSPPSSPARELLNRHLNADPARRSTRWPNADEKFDPTQERRPAQGDRSRPARRWCRRTTSTA